MIKHLSVKGYRLFRDFETDLQPGMNVLIGANGSGKSTLIELLRVIRSCGLGPLPPFIEERPFPGAVYRVEAGPRLSWRVELAGLQPGEDAASYDYAVEIGGWPAVVVREALVSRQQSGAQPGVHERWLFAASMGHGEMRETGRTVSWELKPNEPMLSRATDPSLRECSLVRNDILRWSFYADLCATRSAPLRQPRGLEGGTVLSETGDNLVAVLLALSTNQHFRDHWEELLSFLSAAVPEFETLTTTPDFSGKYVDLQWRERGVQGTLSAADLSDGILRLLILGAICCNPYPASLICIDEPEIGIHPRLLPLVGGLLQHAAERSQVIVLTHSPDVLYDMPIESIAVLRKRDGEAHIVWPRDHELLYDLLTEEIAGERQVDRERLRRAFTSGELDELG